MVRPSSNGDTSDISITSFGLLSLSYSIPARIATTFLCFSREYPVEPADRQKDRGKQREKSQEFFVNCQRGGCNLRNLMI
jgi:hypothetical protein